ncbi:tyrosine-type recombinase/integrase [Brachymonas chironomi]|uniref:tyrosine-type recombinase/integrase n=1 Tax=Brachymonas chironomi TaxID=491919 RepID=UPI0005275E18|nr:tyrosine-type recombinase/integrase [Brachymonas chironomi]
MATIISTVTARNKLKPQREPYWQRASTGLYIGFRKMSLQTAGTWWVRMTDRETGKYSKQGLGPLDEYPDHQRFDEAMKMAMERQQHADKGGIVAAKTVRDACEHYVEHLESTKGEKPAKDAKNRLANLVLRHKKLADLELSKLTPAIIEDWRKKVAKTPITGYSPRKGQPRSAATLNRDMTVFRATLNLAYADAWVTSDFAWRSKLVPVKGAGTRRDIYLDRAQREAMIAAAAPDIALFLRGMSALPLRPGALAQLTVKHYNKALRVLTIGHDKSGADRNIKLPGTTAAIFDAASTNKLASVPLFTRADGVAWNKDSWYSPIREAAEKAGMPAGTSAYTLRHSVITDLVVGGLDLLTVAKLAGTSVAMIEKHYGHLRADHAANALAMLTG